MKATSIVALATSSSLLFGLSACKKSEETPAVPETESTSAVTPVTEAPEVESPVIATRTAEERAGVLGAVKFLPKNTEALLSIFSVEQMLQDLIQFAPVQEALLNTGMPAGTDPLTMLPAEALQAMDFLGEEVFISLGEGTAEQIPSVNELSRIWNELQGGMIIGSLFGNWAVANPLERLTPDHAGRIAGALETLSMPPLIVGARISDEEARAQYLQDLGGLMIGAQMINAEAEIATIISTEKLGKPFHGVSLSGAVAMEFYGPLLLAKVTEELGADIAEALVKNISKNSLTLMFGEVDDCIVFYLGQAEENFILAENPAESLAAKSDLTFVDEWLDKKIFGLSYAAESLITSANQEKVLFSDMATGASKAIREANLETDTSGLVAMLEEIPKAEKDFLSGSRVNRLGSVGFVDSGVRIESYGGYELSGGAAPGPLKFRHLEATKDLILFANGKIDKALISKVLNYSSLFAETAYELGLVLESEKEDAIEENVVLEQLDVEDEVEIEESDPLLVEELEGMQESVEKLTKEQLLEMKPFALNLWEALRGDFFESLGSEVAVLVDTNGGMPTIPDVPKVIIEEGRLPRVAFITEVENRELLAKSWTAMETSVAGMLDIYNETSKTKVNMLKPLSSEKDELKSYFYALPFLTDDFTPSSSVMDERFYLSTSKKFSEHLNSVLAEPNLSDANDLVIRVEFTPLVKYLEGWVMLVENNMDEIATDEMTRKNVEGALEGYEMGAKLFQTLDSLQFKTSEVGGKRRVSIHLRVN